MSVQILIRKIGSLVVAGVYRGRTLLEMIVALSGIGEQWIGEDVAVRSCHIWAGSGISHSAAAENIVESDGRRILAVETSTVETGLPGFCVYYVIGQFRLYIWAYVKDAGTGSGGVVVGNRVIEDFQ